MKWQPIETAPKDGAYVLLYVGAICDDYAVAYWDGTCWNMGSQEYEGGPEFGAPTHWMPLPEAPK